MSNSKWGGILSTIYYAMAVIAMLYSLHRYLITNIGIEKDTAKRTPTENKTALLVGRSWILTGCSCTDQRSVTVSDRYSTMKACEKDDIVKFTADGKVWKEEAKGGTKCNSSDPQIIQVGTWVFANNLTAIIVTTSDDKETVLANLVELTTTTLKYYFPMTEENKFMEHCTWTFTAH